MHLSSSGFLFCFILAKQNLYNFQRQFHLNCFLPSLCFQTMLMVEVTEVGLAAYMVCFPHSIWQLYVIVV